MVAFGLNRTIRILWAAFGIYWVIAARLQSRGGSIPNSPTAENKVSDAPSPRLFHHACLVAAFILLFAPKIAVSALDGRFLPCGMPLGIAGLLFTIAGLALAVWARRHLAENWSSRVRIRIGHELIRTGPYAHLRHPIYSGVLLAVVGSAFVVDRWRALISVALILISYSIKGRREDAVLAREFGDSWLEHRRRAGFLLPRL